MNNSRSTEIKLDCGITATQWRDSNKDWIQVSLIDLYEGYGENSSLEIMGKLFSELAEKGYRNKGLSRKDDGYGETSDLLLNVCR